MASSKTKTAPKKSDSGTKRAKQGVIRQSRNVSIASKLKTQEKKVLKAIGEEVENVKDVFAALASMLDKAVKKGVLHKNKAARKKSLFHKRVGAGKASIAKPVKRAKAPKGESAKEKSQAKAKVKAKAKTKK